MANGFGNTKNIMFKGMLEMNPNMRYEGSSGLAACSFLTPESVRTLDRATARDTCALITVDIPDFLNLVTTGGEELGLSVLEAVIEETKLAFTKFFIGCRVLGMEKTGLGGYILFFRLTDDNSLNFFNAYATFRFTVQEMTNRRLVKLLADNLSLQIGAAFIRPEENDLDRSLFKAFCEAKRVALVKPDSERFTLHKDFLTILERQEVSTYYQPIIDFVSGATMGWEAFSRGPRDTTFEHATPLFGFASETGEALALDRLCRSNAFSNLGGLPDERLLFLNIHPASLTESVCVFTETENEALSYGIDPKRIVFEFTERQSAKDPNNFLRKIEICREKGFRIAIDDVGAGDSSLRLLSQVRPDYIKADISLVGSVDVNPIKRTIVETLVILADKFGGMVIAEGVESETEFSSLVSMGVLAGQGHLFSRPMHPKPEVSVPVPAKSSYKDLSTQEFQSSTTISGLAQEAVSIEHDVLIRDVKTMLGDKPPMSSSVITKHGRPVGLLMNYSMDKRLGTQFGISLYYHRQVSRIMDENPLIVDANQCIEDVARAAMNRDPERIYDDIIVTAEGALVGTVSVQKMLDTLTQVQVELAKGSNPLTGLPGNVAIEQEIERRARKKIPSSILYIDLDNFKVYNDVYGFNNGDQIIMLTAKCLKEAVVSQGKNEEFIGHIGGDDFLILCAQELAEPIAQKMADLFGGEVPRFYNDEDRARGVIHAKGRDGQMGEFPLVSASIGILDVAFKAAFSLEELGQRAAEVKKFAKSRPGNSVVRDRRAPLGSE